MKSVKVLVNIKLPEQGFVKAGTALEVEDQTAAALIKDGQAVERKAAPQPQAEAKPEPAGEQDKPQAKGRAAK